MQPEFVLERDDLGRLKFDLRTAWSADLDAAFRDSKADGLIANYARGFIGRDLNFIRHLGLRRLDVLARTVQDVAPIYDLAPTLEELSIETGSKTKLDLTALPHLQSLACDWTQVVDTINRISGLNKLVVDAYNPQDLTPLAHLTALQSLSMVGRPAVRSVEGLQTLPWLARVGIFGAPLEDTSALAHLQSPVLAELRLTGCRRIKSLSDFQNLIGLRSLDVSEGGEIDSLRPIRELTLLERLHLYDTTKVMDQDLTPLLNLPRLRDLRIKSRRSYRPSVQDVKAHLGIE